MTAALALEQPFALRPYESADESFVVYSWLKSYAHSRYGKARGADVDASPEELRYWAEHQPIVLGLIASSDVVIACDREAPHVVWGWACTQGDTVHYVLCKRSVHQAKLSADIYRALLGERLKRPCGYTHQLVDFARAELRHAGVLVPGDWFADTTWAMRRAA